MTQDKIAKNLLEGKTCDKCEFFREDDAEKTKSCEIWKLPIPTENTCEKWAINPFNALITPKLLLPIIRRVYPSLIAKELVSVQPSFNATSNIFTLRYKGRFKAWLRRWFILSPKKMFSSWRSIISWRRVAFIVQKLSAAIGLTRRIAPEEKLKQRWLNGLEETEKLQKDFQKK
jgi:hypothetical protein